MKKIFRKIFNPEKKYGKYKVLILFLAVFLRIYKVSQYMPFGGDVAWDFIAARDITLKKISLSNK